LKIYVHDAGFNVETVEYKNISFTVWDVGGQDKVWVLLFLLLLLGQSVSLSSLKMMGLFM
jgi:hypothetical protein